MARTSIILDPRDMVLDGQLTIFDVLTDDIEDLIPLFEPSES